MLQLIDGLLKSVAIKRLIKWGLIINLILFTAVSNADNGIKNESLTNYAKTLDDIESSLKRNRYVEDDIPKATKQVAPIKLAASQCINDQTTIVEKLKADLELLGKSSKSEPANVRQKRSELNKEIINAEVLLASCQLFVLRSEEILKALSAEKENLLSARLFAKSPNIQVLIVENWNKPSLWLKATQSFLLNNTGISLLSISNLVTILAVIFLSLITGLIVRKQLCRYISEKMMHDSFSNHFARSFLAVSAFYAPHLLVSLAAATFFYIMTSTVTPVPFISVIAYGLPIYFSLIAIVEIF